MHRTLPSRGIAGPFRLDSWELAGVVDEAIIDALLQCKDESETSGRGFKDSTPA